MNDNVNLEEKIKNYCSSREEIEAVYLFGSRRGKNYNSESDLDLGLMINPEVDKREAFNLKLEIAVKLEELLNIEVDIVSFSRASLRLQQQIIGGKLLLGKDSVFRINCEAKSRREYIDMKPYYEQYEKLMGRGF